MRTATGILMAALVTASTASAQPPERKSPTCFFTTQFSNWKAPDDRTIYISVRPNRIYRLDLAGSCSSLHWPGSHLITTFTSDSVCTALDWQLKVASGPQGPAIPCIVKKMTELSPDEAKAIPPKFKPAF